MRWLDVITLKKSSREDSLSKLKYLADLFQFQPRSDGKQTGLCHKFQPFFPAWLFSNYHGGLLRSPGIQIPSCSAAHLKGSQELGNSPPKFSGYLATCLACWRKAWETLGASDSKYTNFEQFGASQQFQSPGAPRQPFTRPTCLESGCHAGQHTGTLPAPPDKTPPLPLSQRILKGLGLVLHWGEKVLSFVFF